MSDRLIILAGYSGHGLVVADAALQQNLNIIGYCDKFESSFNPFQLKYLGFEEDNNFEGWQNDFDFVLGIGDNKIRQKIFQKIIENNKDVLTILDQTASISKFATIKKGTFVNRNATINAFASIGQGTIINTGAIIDHECTIGDFCHIAPGAVLAGNVTVGEATFIGANAVIKQGVSIGKNVLIGAGSVVVKNINDNEKWFGNPAKKIS